MVSEPGMNAGGSLVWDVILVAQRVSAKSRKSDPAFHFGSAEGAGTKGAVTVPALLKRSPFNVRLADRHGFSHHSSVSALSLHPAGGRCASQSKKEVD